MTTMPDTPTLDPKATAAALRTALRATFPATRFGVTVDRGSMRSSVSIAWTDGPPRADVTALASRFTAGHFDGMTDSYEHDRSRHLLVDGVPYRPGTRFIFTHRDVSVAVEG